MGPNGVMVKAMDCESVVKQVQTPIVQLCSLSDKYQWKRYAHPYPPIYGLKSTTTVHLGDWLQHRITNKS